MPKTYTLNPCKCGGIPQFTEGYDTLQVACPKCGASTRNYVGDCHDEALMLQTYGQQAAREWNDLMRPKCRKANSEKASCPQ